MSNYKSLSERPTGQIHPREVLKCGITESALDGETALFDVLPGIGKSRSIPKVASGTGMQITMLTNLSENYDQYRRWGKEDNINVQKLPVAPDLCPVLQGEYLEDPDAKEALAAYNAGWPAGAVHQEFDMPCDREERTCPYREATAEIDADASEPLVGHFTQAYNPAYVEGRVVVIDEDCFSDYAHQINNPVEEAEKFIATLGEFPFESVRRPEPGEEEKRADALDALEEHGFSPSEYSDSAGEFHAKAPLVAYAIYGAERMENGLYLAEPPNARTAVFDNLLSGDDRDGSVWILDPPDFSKAEAVIALDATPCVSNWRRILGDGLRHYRLLNDDQRNRYLRERGYEFIQLNSYVWPVSGGDVSIAKCEAYLREIARKHGQPPDLITSKDLRTRLEEEGLGDLWLDDLHYGSFRGVNDLADSELLVVLGSPSRADKVIQFQAALHGDCAEPATENGERLSGYDLEYQSDIANDILESTRKGGVFQAAMRAGRAEGTKATVYIATGMIPDWLETQKAGNNLSGGSLDACARPREESDRAVIEVLREEDGISGREVSRRADLPKSTAIDALNRLSNEGLVEKRGRGRGSKWLSEGIENANIAGKTDLGRMADIPYNNSKRDSRPFSDPVTPRREPPADPTNRYPDWMREVQHRSQQRWLAEQFRSREREIL